VYFNHISEVPGFNVLGAHFYLHTGSGDVVKPPYDVEDLPKQRMCNAWRRATSAFKKVQVSGQYSIEQLLKVISRKTCHEWAYYDDWADFYLNK